MKKEIIKIDLTIGQRKFDISKQDEWTKEEWDAYLYTGSEDEMTFNFNLLDDNSLYMQFVNIYFEENEKKLYVFFDIENKFEYNILIKFGKDDELLDSLKIPPRIVKKNELKKHVLGYVQFGDLERSLFMEVKVFNETQTEILRDLGFNVKFYL